MKKNVAKTVMTVVLAGAMMTGQAINIVPLSVVQLQQVYAEQEISVFVDGQELNLNPNAVIRENRILVPLRQIFESMGATVDWSKDYKVITARRKEVTIKLQIDYKKMAVASGENIRYEKLDIDPQIINGSTYVPLRAIAQAFGAQVKWDPTTKTVFITTSQENTVTNDDFFSGSNTYYSAIIVNGHRVEMEIPSNLEPLLPIEVTGTNFSKGTYIPSATPYSTGFSTTDEVIDEILSGIIKPNMTDEQKWKAVYDYMIYNYVHNDDFYTNSKYQQLNKNVPWGELTSRQGRALTLLYLKEGVCDNFAALFTCMMWRLGYQSEVVGGYFINRDGSEHPHAWSVVNYDGINYYFDPDIEANLYRKGYQPSYYVFKQTEEEAKKNHKWIPEQQRKEQQQQPQNIKEEEPQIEVQPSYNYIYGEEEKEIILNTEELQNIESAEDAQKVAENAVKSMTESDKTSADGADKAVLFTNEAVTRASAVKIDTNSIVINDEIVAEIEQKVNDAEQKVSQAFSDVRKVRSNSRNARIVTTSNDTVSIQKESISKNIDNVEVQTNYAKLSFSAKSVSNVSLENKGTNKIAVDFRNKSTTEKVQISFPNISQDKKYMAVIDENGKAIGGKYNPITGELTAKIEKSGIYTVVDNEKNFEDIKDKSAEMQEAIKLLASKGIISGTSETKFSPDKSISRAEVAAIILRTLSKLDENADGGFTDVTKQNWFYGVAGSAKQTGIISGYPDNTFRGNVVIPKVQIVSVTARVLKNEMNYFDISDVEKILSVYGDNIAIAKWAKNDVALATDVNMVIRRTDSLFGGSDEMTRGDAAIILKRLFDKIW